MITLTVLNQKGGVGKTSTSFHLSGMLAGMGRRVLVLDNDPQSSFSQIVFGPEEAGEIDPSETMAAIYRDEIASPESLIRPTSFAGLSIVPGSEAAQLANVPFSKDADLGPAMAIRDYLDYVRDDYDFAIIDCPSNLQYLSFASLVASDRILVPIVPEDLGTQGIAGVERMVETVRAIINPNLETLGYLLGMVTKKAIHKVFEDRLREHYGELVFETTIPNSPAYPEAIAFRKPINVYKPKGIPTARIRSLAQEVLSRTHQMDPVAEMAR